MAKKDKIVKQLTEAKTAEQITDVIVQLQLLVDEMNRNKVSPLQAEVLNFIANGAVKASDMREHFNVDLSEILDNLVSRGHLIAIRERTTVKYMQR